MNQPVSRKDSSNVKQFLLPHLQQFIAEKTGKSLEEVTPNKVEQYLPILLNKIELLLLQEPSINDCAVLLRETQTSEAELVAYIVSTSAFSPEHLASHLQNSFPVALHPKTYIPVAQLPLTPEGEVDKLALSDLPVLDSSLIQKWENQLNLQPEIDQVAVVFEEYVQPNPPLHLADLLPQWKATHSEIVVTSPPETETPPVEQQTESLKTLAISHGKRLELPNELKNLADILKKSVTEACHQGIIYLNSYGEESFQSYPDLLAESEKIMSGLRKIGLNPQDKVIFQLDTNSDIIPGFLACILGGFVPVPISAITTSDPTNNTVKKLLNAWKMLEHPLILTNKNLASQLNNISKSLNLEGFKVAEIESLRDGDRDQNWHPSQPDDLAVLLLTSGSTGIPKGVMLTHRNIVSSVVGTSQMSGFDQQEISLNWLPLDHPGPLIRCVIRIIYLGSQQIHAPTAMVLQEPLKWLDWIEHYHVTTTWAPNFAFALVNDRAEEIVNKKWDLSSVKSLLNTAEPIVPQTDQRFLELLQPHGLSANVMYSSWGMAETSSGVTLSNEYLLDSSQNIEASFVELGSPIAGVSLRIVNQNHEIVEEKTIGYLQVKGATLTQGYYQNSEANEEAFSEDGWFNTGDLGFLDRGRLTITGRTKDVIIVNGNNCYSHEIESAVEEVEGVEVSYTAACGIRQPGSNTDQLLIFFHTAIIENEGLLKLIKEIQKSVVRKIGISPAYLIPVSQETIPKTSIGKIKRSQLKQQFEAGDFDEIVKKIDILLGNQNTLPNWFYRPIWRSKQALILNPIPRKGLTLIFLDELGLGELLYTQLSENQPTVAVEIGSEFVQLSKNRYCIDPKNPQHYQKLLESITTENLAIQQILHLWTYGNYPGETFSLEAVEQAQKYGVYSLLFLVQALEKVQVSQASVRIQIVSSHSQAVSASDQVACERSPILGLVKTIPQELTWIDCRHLDLPTEQLEINLKSILTELQVIQPEQEVAYRNGKRMISRLERVDLQQNRQEPPFTVGGMYLITGGLGGIAVEIAKYLLGNYQARLLLIGRTSLPERNTWSKYLEQNNKIANRIKAYLALEKFGKIAYEAADICDLNKLEEIVQKHSQNWQCELEGVIHLAGLTSRRLLAEETSESLAATLRPKVTGTLVLNQLLQNKPNRVFITFSSVNGYFGGLSAGAYSAANRFLDIFSQSQYSKSRLNYCFAWSMWDETGMSRNYQMKDLTRTRGYSIITPEQGLNSFLAGLYYQPGYLLVGLDESKSFIRQYTKIKTDPTQQLVAYFTSTVDPLALTDFQSLEIPDRFGIVTQCKLKRIKQIPLTESGEIDREQLAAMQGKAKLEQVAPQNEIEHLLVGIWQEILGKKSIGIRDNFFELGGNSLQALRLLAKIETTFKQIFPLATLFQAPTIEQFASLFTDSSQQKPQLSLVKIQPKGYKPPLFCVHGGGFNVLIYRHLSDYLGSDQPVYGLQARGVDGILKAHSRVEEMAADYINEIREVQPQGPYYLIGLSNGGKIALEMAQQLHQQNETVALLGMIDTPGPDYPKLLPPIPRLFSVLGYILQYTMPRFLNKLRKKGLKAVVNKLSKTKPPSPLQTKSVMNSNSNTQPVAKQLGVRHIAGDVNFSSHQMSLLEQWIHRLNIQVIKNSPLSFYSAKAEVQGVQSSVAKAIQNLEEAHDQAHSRYKPTPYPGRITIFQASEQLPGFYPDSNLGWSQIAIKGVESYEIPGHHYTVARSPILAEKLRACLDRLHAENR